MRWFVLILVPVIASLFVVAISASVASVIVDATSAWSAPAVVFAESFANGVEPETAAVLAAVQRPAAEFDEPSGPPAWKTIPSWSLIGTLDHVIPPALQEQMSNRAGAHITTVKAGHLSLITRPAEVTKVILSAVDATT